MNLKKELLQLKEQLEKIYVIYHNDGTTTKENSKIIFKKNSLWKPFEGIVDETKAGYERFANCGYQIEGLNFGMDIGILYDAEDVCDGKVIEGAKPIDQLIYYCSKNLDLYTEDDKLDSEAYNNYRVRHYGFMNYSDFIAKAKEEGFTYEGPKTFDELVAKINNGEPFDINLFIGLYQDEKNITSDGKLEVIEETKEPKVEVKPVSKKKSIFKRK